LAVDSQILSFKGEPCPFFLTKKGNYATITGHKKRYFFRGLFTGQDCFSGKEKDYEAAVG
jgi:hypothetical protein